MEIEKIEQLSSIRKNIISWYQFNKNETILQINKECKEITDELIKKAKNVCTINSIEETDTIIDKKFDYILLYGLENFNYSLNEFLEFSKKYINEDGTILFTCDNRYGLQNYNINCEITENKNYLSKIEIEEILKEKNIEKYKFYYPLPNYKIPNVIFTDRHLPNNESILRDFTLYSQNEILAVDEREKYKEILSDNKELFKIFANSFLVEISNESNNIEFISFNNSRKEKYRIKTVMKNDIVSKESVDKSGLEHIKTIKRNIDILKKLDINMLDEYKENTIYSKIMPQEKSFDKILIEKYKKQEIEDANILINDFITEIKNKLSKCEKTESKTVFEKYNINIDKEISDKLNFIKYGFFDLIFQNCFYEENKFYFYDQEWMEENIPIEFIIYRTIEYLANSSKIINRNQLFEKFKITEFIEIFNKLETVLQEEIKDEEIWKIHAENRITVKNLYDTQVHYRNLISLAEQKKENEKNSNEREINMYKQNINELTTELNIIKNSKSWKMTEILRKIRRKL